MIFFSSFFFVFFVPIFCFFCFVVVIVMVVLVILHSGRCARDANRRGKNPAKAGDRVRFASWRAGGTPLCADGGGRGGGVFFGERGISSQIRLCGVDAWPKEVLRIYRNPTDDLQGV